ncbi:S1C family serine protease [Neolewinella antarctica]|uniref:S1-C subfamily serine protease n=1 Tax=Neolewinella antarctica TaxID=442734 RepID=A0ABX0X8R4_9BACT|nr:trypsin-like peptidase domain-containing protein [Neolewinella antarctica]NJC25650.1 S1-C subfamily serine protease [Neolewinella antarctica]
MKNFFFSFLIIFLSFLAGGYLFPGGFFSNNLKNGATEMNVRNVTADLFSDQATLPKTTRPVGNTIAYTDQELHTINLFESASPGVCYITTKTRQRSFWNRDVTEVPSGSGSGFVWDKNGHIITNYHVIKDASKAIVTLADGVDYQASLVGAAKEKDLAVLKIQAPANVLMPVPVGVSSNIRVGQAVYAIGNPFGLDQSLTTGIVSALDREINSQANVPIRGVIQSDAAINPGNSGGPLLDSRGQLIGVNTAIYSPSGASAGIGFSIPVDVVSVVVPDLIQYGELRRASIGAEFRPLRQGQGLAFYEIMPNSAAARYGLRAIYEDKRSGQWLFGDILTGINGQAVTNTTELYLELEKYQPGQKVQLNIVRKEQESAVEIVLGSSVE